MLTEYKKVVVGTPGLEPGRPIKPTDFKSVVFTNFTMPPKVCEQHRCCTQTVLDAASKNRASCVLLLSCRSISAK